MCCSNYVIISRGSSQQWQWQHQGESEEKLLSALSLFVRQTVKKKILISNQLRIRIEVPQQEFTQLVWKKSCDQYHTLWIVSSVFGFYCDSLRFHHRISSFATALLLSPLFLLLTRWQLFHFFFSIFFQISTPKNVFLPWCTCGAAWSTRTHSLTLCTTFVAVVPLLSIVHCRFLQFCILLSAPVNLINLNARPWHCLTG